MRNYTFDATKGVFLVAYPNSDVTDTEFEFQYWAQAYKDSWVDRIWYLNFTGSFGRTVLIVLIVVIFIFVMIICCICYCCFKNSSNKRY